MAHMSFLFILFLLFFYLLHISPTASGSICSHVAPPAGSSAYPPAKALPARGPFSACQLALRRHASTSLLGRRQANTNEAHVAHLLGHGRRGSRHRTMRPTTTSCVPYLPHQFGHFSSYFLAIVGWWSDNSW
jgi:hypothetical protein